MQKVFNFIWQSKWRARSIWRLTLTFVANHVVSNSTAAGRAKNDQHSYCYFCRCFCCRVYSAMYRIVFTTRSVTYPRDGQSTWFVRIHTWYCFVLRSGCFFKPNWTGRGVGRLRLEKLWAHGIFVEGGACSFQGLRTGYTFVGGRLINITWKNYTAVEI